MLINVYSKFHNFYFLSNKKIYSLDYYLLTWTLAYFFLGGGGDNVYFYWFSHAINWWTLYKNLDNNLLWKWIGSAVLKPINCHQDMILYAKWIGLAITSKRELLSSMYIHCTNRTIVHVYKIIIYKVLFVATISDTWKCISLGQ